MRFKHFLSLFGSLFLFSGLKAQVKKETTPQVKKTTPVVTSDNSQKLPQKDMKNKGTLPEKQTSTNLPITVKPSNKAEDPKSLPITVKPSTKKEDPKNLPITVKPSKQTGTQKSMLNVNSGDVIYIADFAQDSLGEMPANWKTKSIGELKTVSGREGKWLKLDESANYVTSFNQTIPGDFKIEFDFIANYQEGQGVPELVVRVFQKGADYREGDVAFLLSPNGGSAANPSRIQISAHEVGPGEFFRAEARHLTTFVDKNGKNEPVHVVLSIKKDKVKAWLDGEKVYDLQEVVPPNVKFDRLGFSTGSYGGPKKNFEYYISNIKIIAD